MSDRLVIEQVRIDRFGGLEAITRELPDDPFVVIAGSNESGKSSLSELISWLLVGPSGSAEQAQRFGDPEDTVGGTLSGVFRGRRFESTGSFKILARGAPKPGFIVEWGGETILPDEWARRLGGIDAAILDAVYRMWGADLHEGDEVKSQIEDTALAAIAGAGNVGQVRKSLAKAVTVLLTSRAKGAESFKTLQAEVKQRRVKISEIMKGADNYRDLCRDLAEINADAERHKERCDELEREIAARKSLLAVSEDRTALKQVRQDLAELEAVPDAWIGLATDTEQIASSIDDIEELERAADATVEEFTRVRSGAGFTVSEAEKLQVTTVNVVTITRLLGDLETASDAQASAIQARERAEKECAARSEAHEREKTQCSDMSDERLRAVQLDAATLANIGAAIGKWEQRERDREEAREKVDDHKREIDKLEQRRVSSGQAWEKQETGGTPQEWFRTGAVTPVAVSSAGSLRLVASFVLAAAVALVAILSLPPVAGAVVTLCAFAVAFAFTRRRWGAPVAHSGPSQGAAEAVLAAAEALIAAESDLDRARSAGLDLQQSEEKSAGQCRVAADEASQLAAAAGFELGTEVHKARVRLTAIDEATRAMVALDDANAARRSAMTAETSARSRRGEFLTEMRSALDVAGVPDRVPEADAAGAIGELRKVSDARSDHADAMRKVSAAVDAFTVLIAPVASEVADSTKAQVLKRARHFADINERRSELETGESTLSRSVDKHMSGDELAREISRSGFGPDELTAQKAEKEADLEAVAKAREDLIDRGGTLKGDIKAAQQKTDLARLRDEMGALEEAGDDRIIEAAAHAVAGTLLASVSEEQKQANQPAIVLRASELFRSVAPEWPQLNVETDEDDDLVVSVRDGDGVTVPSHKLSTGTQALLYLSFRLAMAELDGKEKRGLQFPIICDDPLVHLDDERARLVPPLLRQIADAGHQVIMFTCHGRTVEAARANGAAVVSLDADAGSGVG